MPLLRRHIAIVALALIPGLAVAQDRQKPRVLLIFDTSGSMGVDVATGLPTGGDNSEAHPGDGSLSRLFLAKEALTGLVTTQSEVEFALLRYPQIEGLGINRGVIDGRQNNSYEDLDERPLNYAGECSGRLRPGGPDDPFALLVPFGPDNEAEMVRWLDHREAFPDDRELRADGPTPLAETLRLAGDYLAETGAADPGARCRRTAVVLLTDGSESCVPFAEREAALAAQADALRRLRFTVDGEPVEQDVRTFVLAYAVNQRALDQLGVLARAGGTAVDPRGELDLDAGGPYEAEDLLTLRRAFNAIIREAIPTELCNGLDDDCDGVIDEGVQNACGACGDPPVEACDGIDDDCDGRIDEGALNACGRCGPLPDEICNDVDDDCDGAVDEAVDNACGGCALVSEEVCNGVDDDCDGRVDNRPGTDSPLARPCSNAVGACREGLEACRDGLWGACDGVEPRPEQCDGADDDCDGQIDEDTVPCGPAVELGIGDVGECRAGFRRCDPDACLADPDACDPDGWRSLCEDAVGPVDEACNGRDDDCDGEIDEGLINACGQCGPPPPEACNGIDDNCDGRVDDDARCPGGFVCLAGECVQPCAAAGECSPGLDCVTAWPGARYCHPNPCAAAYCPPGTACDPDIGACIDACSGVECDPGQVCDAGVCADDPCGCAEGERCVAGACEPDPCAGVDCTDGFCREGECVDACRNVSCGEGRACIDGLCVADPCEGLCLRGARCDPVDGACVADPCAAISCPAGTACSEGECTAEALCAFIECPTGTVCANGTCTDFTPGVDPRSVPEPDMAPPRPRDAGPVDMAEPDMLPDALPEPRPPIDDGDDCAQAPTGGSAPWTLMLLLAAGAWRRRQRP